MINREDGNCLHVDGDGDFPNDYTNVITSGCNESNNQKWAFNGEGQLIHTPSEKCLDMGKSSQSWCTGDPLGLRLHFADIDLQL